MGIAKGIASDRPLVTNGARASPTSYGARLGDETTAR